MNETIRIIIADDHPIVREGLAGVLNQEPDLAVVGQAKTGLEAVDQAQELTPDIVLMDLQMPEMDGVAAIKEIKEKNPEIGIIILTTYDTDEYIFNGIIIRHRVSLLTHLPGIPNQRAEICPGHSGYRDPNLRRFLGEIISTGQRRWL